MTLSRLNSGDTLVIPLGARGTCLKDLKFISMREGLLGNHYDFKPEPISNDVDWARL